MPKENKMNRCKDCGKPYEAHGECDNCKLINKILGIVE